MSQLRRAVEALPNPGTVGSWDRRLAEGLVNLGSFNGSTVGQLGNYGSWLHRLYDALTPKPTFPGGSYAMRLCGGGYRELADAVIASVDDAGEGGGGGEDDSDTGQIGMNLQLSGNSYFGTEYPFLDRFKTAWGGTDSLWRAKDGDGNFTEDDVAVNAAGWPTAIPGGAARVVTFVGLDPTGEATSNDYVILYTGTITIELGGGTVTDSSAGRIEFTSTATDGILELAVTAITTTPTIRVVRADQESLLDAGDLFNPAFIEKTQQWESLRFMHWGQNATAIPTGLEESTWASRYQQSDATWGYIVPIEVMVALCNECNVDLWYCVPFTADDTFVTNAATYIRDTLDSGLKAHIEWSNETWNFGYPVWAYCDDAAQGGAVFPADGAKGYKYAGYRAAQVAALCRTVFAAQPPRLKNCLGTQLGYLAVMDYKKAGADHAAVGDFASLFDELGITSYFGNTLMGTGGAEDRATLVTWAGLGATGLDNAFQEMEHGGLLTDVNRYDLDYWADTQLPAHSSWAAGYGLDLVCYEGGPHLAADTFFTGGDKATMSAFFDTLSADDRMGDLVTRMCVEWQAVTNSRDLSYFQDSGVGSIYGQWGALDSTYSAQSPKYNALSTFQGRPPALQASATVADALVGSSVAIALVISGGIAPWSAQIISGSLATGRSLVGTSITGTYSAEGSFSATIEVSDSSSPPQTVEVPIDQDIGPAAVAYRYYSLIASDANDAGGYMSIAEVRAYREGVEIPISAMAVSDFTAPFSADLMIDDNDATFYHSDYETPVNYPHRITMDLGVGNTVAPDQLGLTPRAGSLGAMPKTFSVYGHNAPTGYTDNLIGDYVKTDWAANDLFGDNETLLTL